MDLLISIIPGNIIEAIGWTIFHSVWQGVFISIILGISILAINNKNSRFRYALGVTSLFIMLASAAITFINVYKPAAGFIQPGETNFMINGQNLTSYLNPADMPQNVLSLDSMFGKIQKYFSSHLSLIATVWFAGLMILSLRFFGGLIYIRRLRNNGLNSIDEQLLNTFEFLLKKMKLNRSVKIFYSALVKIPTAIGYLKPVILLPLSFASGLTQNQIEAVLAHEIAHIKRNDFIVNIIQTIAEIIFFYHPAAWLISSFIRKERENCCDDYAIGICGNSVEYSKALLAIQQTNEQTTSFVLAAVGNDNNLFRRIKRMNDKRENQNAYGIKFAAFAILAVFVGVVSLYSESSNNRNETIVEAGFSNPFSLQNISSYNTKDVFDASSGDTIKNLRSGKRTFKFYETESGERKKFKAKLNNGKLQDLYIDGEQVPAGELDKYQNRVDQKINDYESVLAEYRKHRDEYRKMSKEYAEKLKDYREKLRDYRNNSSEWKIREEFSSQELSELQEAMHELQFKLTDDFAHNSFVMPPIPPIPHIDIPEINIPEIDIPEIHIPQISIPPIHIDADNFNNWDSEEWSSNFNEKMDSLKEKLKNTHWNNEEFKENMKEFRKQMKINKLEMDSFRDSMKTFDEKMKIFGVEMKKFGKFIKTATDEMIDDGIIESGDDLDSFYLSENKMKVNRISVSPELLTKYLNLYEKHTGQKMEGDRKISINN